MRSACRLSGTSGDESKIKKKVDLVVWGVEAGVVERERMRKEVVFDRISGVLSRSLCASSTQRQPWSKYTLKRSATIAACLDI